jgi:hypothetical protein
MFSKFLLTNVQIKQISNNIVPINFNAEVSNLITLKNIWNIELSNVSFEDFKIIKGKFISI